MFDLFPIWWRWWWLDKWIAEECWWETVSSEVSYPTLSIILSESPQSKAFSQQLHPLHSLNCDWVIAFGWFKGFTECSKSIEWGGILCWMADNKSCRWKLSQRCLWSGTTGDWNSQIDGERGGGGSGKVSLNGLPHHDIDILTSRPTDKQKK